MILRGVASFYGKDDGFHGRCMANGAFFDKEAMTAAHKSLPFGTKVRVAYHNRSVEVEITDRGPYKKGRIIDLSEKAARDLGIVRKGIVQVTVEVITVPEFPETYFHENPSCIKDEGEVSGRALYARG
jgi:rare lipoprotein A